ncbi:right-handed parallel beta-helix repeat-containing protein [Streptomyces sp. HD1123-B1]|uniref:right-handed parallel beta-helix repeat-containing protein n=1 Tax=Streptomyces huangiella TaxID=3228804 RepID=UPI003D7C7E5D
MSLRKTRMSRPTRSLAVAAAMAATVVAIPTATPAYAASVPCNDAQLVSAVAGVANTGGTLSLAPGCTYTLTTAQTDQDGLAPITAAVTIQGNGATITRSSTDPFRIFDVNGGSLTLSNLTVDNGSVTGLSEFGGGILVRNAGTLRGSSVTLTDNSSERNGGGLTAFQNSTVVLTNSLVTGNHALFGGGVNSLSGSLTMSGTTVRDNTAGFEGGGLEVDGTATFTGVTITGNTVTGVEGGGGMYIGGGTLTLQSSTVSDNESTNGSGLGGGIELDTGSLISRSSRITDNTSAGPGGGVSGDDAGNQATFSSTVISGNTAETGGGVYNEDGVMSLTSGAVTGNTAVDAGAGLFNTGQLTLSRVSVSQNILTGAAGTGAAIFNSGTLGITGASILANRATGAGSVSGGLYNDGGAVTLSGSSISGNSSLAAPGGIYTTTPFSAAGSSVSGNQPTNCAGSPVIPTGCVN